MSIDAHLSGTGHASLASLRREFDAMRAEVAAWRAFCDEAEDSSWPNAWADYAENLTRCEAVTDDARPKEPT